MSKLNYVNLGCGSHFHGDWINIDFISNSTQVIAHNLLSGIPIDNNAAEVVYHSHVLEHFPKEKAGEFLAECFRILKPGGIIRIAIPDLEQIISHYNRIINRLNIEPENVQLWADYDWIMLEMYDQTVRNYSGGTMGQYLTSDRIINKEFVIERCGEEARNIMSVPDIFKPTTSRKVQSKSSFLKEMYRLIRYGRRRERLIRLVLASEFNLLQTSRFRAGGEIHQWMYDRFSLGRLLKESGYENYQIKTAFESDIKDWSNFNLDGKNGVVRKPDSLFVEARKPF